MAHEPTRRRAMGLLAAAFTAVPLASAAGAAFGIADLAGGQHALLMRHTLAPGTGDPPHFELGDCATQRNLNGIGREQARAWGRRLRAAGIDEARVFSSQWCRCLETARLLGFGPVQPLPPLNSFFQDRSRGPAQTQALEAFLADLEPGPMPILVTHQVNITALTGVVPVSGEAVALRLEPGLPVAGVLDPPDV